jgi:hypothetical protein
MISTYQVGWLITPERWVWQLKPFGHPAFSVKAHRISRLANNELGHAHELREEGGRYVHESIVTRPDVSRPSATRNQTQYRKATRTDNNRVVTIGNVSYFLEILNRRYLLTSGATVRAVIL